MKLCRQLSELVSFFNLLCQRRIARPCDFLRNDTLAILSGSALAVEYVHAVEWWVVLGAKKSDSFLHSTLS